MFDRPLDLPRPVASRPAPRFVPRGFSLLELMIALSIGAILVGLALPSMSSLMGGSKMGATVNDLVYSLQSARSEAIKRAGTVVLCPSTTSLDLDASCAATSYASGWIVFADADVDGQRDADEELIIQSEPRDATFTFTTPGGTFASRVLFTDTGISADPIGNPLSGALRIVQASADETRDVLIAANGRVSSETP